jgi:hypothetical protein
MEPSYREGVGPATAISGAARKPLSLRHSGQDDGAFMEPSGRNRWQPGRKWEAPENGSNRPIGNRSQPTATVSERSASPTRSPRTPTRSEPDAPACAAPGNARLHAHLRRQRPAEHPTQRPRRRSTRTALETTFSGRRQQELPSSLPTAPADWATPYRRLAAEVGVEPDLMAAFAAAAAFLDPILAGRPREPGTQPCAAGPSDATGIQRSANTTCPKGPIRPPLLQDSRRRSRHARSGRRNPLGASDSRREDGAFMEPSGGNEWQPLAHAPGPNTAQTSRSATPSNPQQRFRSASCAGRFGLIAEKAFSVDRFQVASDLLALASSSRSRTVCASSFIA